MGGARVRLWATLLPCLALGCVTTRLEQRDWLEVRTPHFDVVSSLGPEATLELARDVESFRAAVGYLADASLAPAPIRTRVYAFDETGFERPFDRRGEPGYFLPLLRGPVIVLRAGGGWRGDARPWLRHRYAHYLVRNQQGLELPLWYDEGLARVASTTRAEAGRAEVGILAEDSVRRLRAAHWIPVDRTLGATDLEGWSRRERAVFEDQAWALLHYLKFGQPDPARSRSRGPLAAYFGAVERGETGVRALRRALGDPDLDRELRSYIRQDHFVSIVLRLPRAGATSGSPRLLGPAEVATQLGWLSIALGRGEQAQRYFETALATIPDHARAQAGLGAAAALREQWPQAKKGLARALRLSPEDALTQLDVARFYHAESGAAADGESRALLAKLARQHYVRSRALDAFLPETHAGLGATFLLEGQDPAAGLAPAQRARSLLPSSLEVVLLLARLHDALGQRAKARRLALAVLSHAHQSSNLRAAGELLGEPPDAGAERSPTDPARVPPRLLARNPARER